LPTLSLPDTPPESSPAAELQIQEAPEGLAVEQSLQRYDLPVGMNWRRIQELFLRALRELPRW
jgi:hypothetical protein